MTINEQKKAYLYFFASYCGKSHHIHDSDIFWLIIKIPDKNNLFATLEDNRLKIVEKVETRPLKIAENMEEKFEGSHSEEYKEYGWRIIL